MKRFHPVVKETKEAKRHRIKAQKSHHEDRSAKRLLRDKDERKHFVKLARMFGIFGVNYPELQQRSFDELREMYDGKRIEDLDLNDEKSKFLQENFEFHFMKDYWGYVRIYFTAPRKQEDKDDITIPSKLVRLLAKESGQPRTVANAVYLALIEVCKRRLKRKRKILLPGLGRFSVLYRKPVQGEETFNTIPACANCSNNGTLHVMDDAPQIAKCNVCFKEAECRLIKTDSTFPIKPAYNRLRMTPSKLLRTWAMENIEVVPPAKPRKPKEKRKRRKKVKSYFEEQMLPATGKTLDSDSDFSMGKLLLH